MRILNRNVYVGPSQYAKFPVIRLELDLGALEQWPTARLGDAFIDGLVAALPGLAEHGCSYREPGGFIRRMREGEGTWLGHVQEHVAIELQNVAGEDVTSARPAASPTIAPACTRWSYEYAQKEEGIAAGELALKLLDSLLPAELRQCHRRLLELGRRARWFHPLRAASRAGPVDGLAGEGRGGPRHPVAAAQRAIAVQLGHGKYQQRIQATVTGRTPTHCGGAGQRQGRDQQDPRLAGPAGAAPGTGAVGRCRLARCAPARRPGGAQALQRQPRPRHHINVIGEDEVRAGFEAAREHSRSVIVETYLAGDDHRLLVVNGELIAATRRTPGHVVGDGASTVAQLVEEVNCDPRRGVGHEKVPDQAQARPRGRADAGAQGLHR